MFTEVQTSLDQHQKTIKEKSKQLERWQVKGGSPSVWVWLCTDGVGCRCAVLTCECYVGMC